MESIIEQALQKAVEAQRAGKLKDAERLYRAILQAEPQNPDANHNLGVIAVSLNQAEAALPFFKIALEANSSQGQFWLSYIDALIKEEQFDNAKIVLLQGKTAGLEGERVDELEAQLTTSLLVQSSETSSTNKVSTLSQERKKVSAKKEKKKNSIPNQKSLNLVQSPSQVEMNTVLKHYQEGLYDLAENLAKAITQKYPNHLFGWKVLGAVFKQTGRLQDSLALNQKIVDMSPNDADALYNLGITLQALGRLEDAEASYKKAIVIKPEDEESHYNLGITLKELGRLEDAKTSYKKAIAIRPDYAEAYSNLGLTLQELGRLEEAAMSYRKAIALKPESAKTHSNLGITLQALLRLEEAEISYKKAIALNPEFAEAYSNLGITLHALLRLEDAEICYKKAIALNPKFAEAFSNFGATLKDLGRLAEAETSYKKAIALNPELATAKQNYSLLLAFMSNYTDLHKFSDDALKHAQLNCSNANELLKIWEARLFTYIYHPDLSAQEICDEHKRWGNQFASLGQEAFADHDRTPKRRLRIGYVSPDFRGHTCRFYFEPLFSQHDHTNFELFAYSSVLHEDEHTQRFKPYFDHWRDIHRLSDEAAAQMIRQDKIDILVDGCGHMMDTRLTVFAHKPAPIQVTWLGSAWTTGLPQMDYVLFDPYMAPEGTAASEQIVRLPRTWAAFRPGERATQASVKASPAITNGYVTFGYSGRSERLNHRVFNAWGRILARLPEARLVLDYKAFVDPNTQAYYKDFLQKHGVNTSRIIMRNSENIFEGLGDIDILLDSFPHSGGTMLFDAIWMGVPALTLASPRPVGRIGTSLMTNLGLPDWVAQDQQEYEDKAITFAQDIPALASIRSGMRARMQASAVMNEKAFSQDVENAYQTMWCNWVSYLN